MEEREMAFCTNCGQELMEGAKFCSSCGMTTNNIPDNMSSQRKTFFEGEMHKCPNCGEVLKSFASSCPTCGYEVRGAKSIHEFALRIANAETDAQKISVIRSFPIPNTKEDVLEFIILAATNFNAEQSLSDNGIKKDVSDAWFTKIEQSYQKAKLLFSGDKDFSKIQSVYEQTCNQIRLSKQNVKKGAFANAILHTIGLWSGLIIFIIAFFLDIFTYSNTSVFHLGGGAIMIAGAFMIGKKSKAFIEVGIGVVCGLFALLLGTLLQETFFENGSMMVLTGGATLIIVIIRLVTTTLKK